MIPVADSEFARDATFGYRSSRLADWVAEKSEGRIDPRAVLEIPLAAIRSESTSQLAGRLSQARNRQVVVVDAVTDDDLRAVALALLRVRAQRLDIRLPHRSIVRTGPYRPGIQCAHHRLRTH